MTRGQDIAALLQQWLVSLHRLPPRSLRHYAVLAEAALARLSPMRQLR
ncbi:hypothetical protein JZM24_16155 [Candidatus Sodalis endolongispinus]|uniref:Uncharacterized protein n=1 Tax=Candidatus Sodalis endolongispinus TaxID=2812662 RepID=A0ABS5YEA3_9GAMM|nr:hypothetical protein [Candidatus Sodalis endolongispinus]MBT9433264.1 hypothetical protein [Candidatus Sodalis endolongispinus]